MRDIESSPAQWSVYALNMWEPEEEEEEDDECYDGEDDLEHRVDVAMFKELWPPVLLFSQKNFAAVADRLKEAAEEWIDGGCEEMDEIKAAVKRMFSLFDRPMQQTFRSCLVVGSLLKQGRDTQSIFEEASKKKLAAMHNDRDRGAANNFYKISGLHGVLVEAGLKDGIETASGTKVMKLFESKEAAEGFIKEKGDANNEIDPNAQEKRTKAVLGKVEEVNRWMGIKGGRWATNKINSLAKSAGGGISMALTSTKKDPLHNTWHTGEELCDPFKSNAGDGSERWTRFWNEVTDYRNKNQAKLDKIKDSEVKHAAHQKEKERAAKDACSKKPVVSPVPRGAEVEAEAGSEAVEGEAFDYVFDF